MIFGQPAPSRISIAEHYVTEPVEFVGANYNIKPPWCDFAATKTGMERNPDGEITIPHVNVEHSGSFPIRLMRFAVTRRKIKRVDGELIASDELDTLYFTGDLISAVRSGYGDSRLWSLTFHTTRDISDTREPS